MTGKAPLLLRSPRFHGSLTRRPHAQGSKRVQCQRHDEAAVTALLVVVQLAVPVAAVAACPHHAHERLQRDGRGARQALEKELRKGVGPPAPLVGEPLEAQVGARRPALVEQNASLEGPGPEARSGSSSSH
jgi:hypothetical protein